MRNTGALVLALAFALSACGGCGGCGKHEATVDAGAPEPPVPAPPNLLAEGIVAAPDTTWTHVQRGVGGLLAIMAPTIGGLAASLAGAEPALGPEIDGSSPAYLAMAGSPPSLVVALRLRSASRAREVLGGDAGRFRAAGEQGALALFEPTGNGLAVGVASSGWIVFGKTKDDVTALGPYAYRTLPTRALPKSNAHLDFTHDAFAGWLVGLATTKWTDAKTFLLGKDAEARAAHGGREADFGDAKAIVDVVGAWVDARGAAAADVKSGALDVDVREEAIAANLSLEPGGGASKTMLEAMHPGPMKIGAVPADAFAVACMRDDLAGRKDSAKSAADALQKILGKRLTADEGKHIGSALDAWASARGDWLGIAATSRGALVRAPAADRADAATKDLVSLADASALRAPIEAIAGGGKSPIAWAVKDGTIRIAIAGHAQELLDAPGDERITAALDKVGDASFAIAGHVADPDPISSLAARPKDGRIVITLDASPILARQILKSVAGM